MARKRVVFLMSDTGAGHRAAADAIRAAMEARYPGLYAFELVDVYRRYTPFPFTRLPEIYPRWVDYAPLTWELVYHAANAPYRGRLAMAVINRLWRGGTRRMVVEHSADVVVSVHALFSRPIMHAFNQTRVDRPPFVTVITDLVTTHAFWYERDVDRCLVPTQAAYDRGRAFGLSPDQLRVTGLPVHPQFVDGLLPKDEARRRLNLHPTLPAILVAGGGDGMGPVYDITRELNRRQLAMQLVVIAGRNRVLRRRLEAVRWNQPTLIYPFVNNMPELMAAADILVTKAGPTTICEACLAGLPIVLSGAVPGQEDGNVTFVVQSQAGAYAPGAQQVADTVAQWLAAGSGALSRRAAQARRLASPGAVWEIADEIHAQVQRGPLPTRLHANGNGHHPRLYQTPEDGWVI